MSAFRTAAQMIAHQPVEPVEVLTHVRRPDSNINPRRRSKSKHSLHPVQDPQQMFQRSPIKSAPHFDPVTASHLNYQKTLAARISIATRPNYFHGNHPSTTRCRTLMRAPAIFIQRSYSQTSFLTESFPR
jgi:hypothetical protein